MSSPYDPTVRCEKCGSDRLRPIAPLRLHFQPHVHCDACDHEELELLAFLRWSSERDNHQPKGEN